MILQPCRKSFRGIRNSTISSARNLLLYLSETQPLLLKERETESFVFIHVLSRLHNTYHQGHSNMRRFYILPMALWEGKIETGTHYESGGKTTPVMVWTHNIFDPNVGSHGIVLSQTDPHILICTSVSHSEFAEDLFHGHPEVALLPHPGTMGTMKLAEHIQNTSHRYTSKHHEMLKAHPDIKATDFDTVLTLAKKCEAVHPLMKLRNVL
jgi:hypothetical protein